MRKLTTLATLAVVLFALGDGLAAQKGGRGPRPGGQRGLKSSFNKAAKAKSPRSTGVKIKGSKALATVRARLAQKKQALTKGNLSKAFDRAVYGKSPAKRKTGTTVIGHYPKYVQLSGKNRFFYVPKQAWNGMSKKQQWAANKKFLDRTIKRGDRIVLKTPKVQSGTALSKEIAYLKSKGYVLNKKGEFVRK